MAPHETLFLEATTAIKKEAMQYGAIIRGEKYY